MVAHRCALEIGKTKYLFVSLFQSLTSHATIIFSMAYSRDWDKGKSAWGDAGAWGDGSGRGHFRPRDEDYQGDGKRRKYNNGVNLFFHLLEFKPDS